MFGEKMELLILKVQKYRKYLYVAVGLIWILVSILLIHLLKQPSVMVKELYNNDIMQNTSFAYQADVLPYSLHPSGGIIDITSATFTEVTRDIIIHIQSSIKAERPIRIRGSKKIILRLVAEDLWEKEYILSDETSFQLEGTENLIVDTDYSIKLQDLIAFMEQLEKEVNTRPGRYTFQIEPVISGVIIDGDYQVPIDLYAYTTLEYSQAQILITGEKEFTKSTPIISTQTIEQSFGFLGLTTSLLFAKYLFTGLYLAILSAIIIRIVQSIRRNKSEASEVQLINKKYKLRFIDLLQELDASEYQEIPLDSFQGLLTISDERDSPILRYEDSLRVIYYVLADGYHFLYRLNKQEEKLDLHRDPIIYKEVL